MYTIENLVKRKRLVSNPQIVEAIGAFWHVLDLTKDAGGTIGMNDFVIMNIKMQRTLMPGLRINVSNARSSTPSPFIYPCLDLHAVIPITILMWTAIVIKYIPSFQAQTHPPPPFLSSPALHPHILLYYCITI